MSDKVLWPLDPHTGAKHAILKMYLDRWFPILGKYYSRINYIDGFAGPGEYKEGEKGSPVLAIESALEHVSRGTLGSNVTINFIFIEGDENHAAHLRMLLDKLATPPQFKIGVVDGQFRDCIGDILSKLESEKKSLAPTFAFVDPFGFSGIPMSLMGRILKFQHCEVFINIMADFINRFLEHPNDAITSHFPETFGCSDVLNIPKENGNRLDMILKLYRRQLNQFGKYVGRFDMHGRKDRKTYSLYFATNAAKGFEKMKESMWSVDKYTGSKFSDADQNPNYLFDSWGYDSLWEDIVKQYAGKDVPMSCLENFVIEKTDFLPTHLRKLLTQHEESGHITVEVMPNCKRRGKTFPREKVRIIFSK
jgi:three-Cys-motif partner protein